MFESLGATIRTVGNLFVGWLASNGTPKVEGGGEGLRFQLKRSRREREILKNALIVLSRTPMEILGAGDRTSGRK